MPTSEYIETRNGGCYVAGTRIGLDVVTHAFRRGRTAEDILRSFPSIGSLAKDMAFLPSSWSILKRSKPICKGRIASSKIFRPATLCPRRWLSRSSVSAVGRFQRLLEDSSRSYSTQSRGGNRNGQHKCHRQPANFATTNLSGE